MEIKIYIDVLLLMNTVFDYLLLWVTGFLLKRRVETLRLLMVSFFGGLYAVCVFFLPDFMYHLPCKLFVGALLVILAFKPKSFRLCVQYISVFLTAVFLLGGVAFFALFYTRLGSCFGAAYRNGSFYINMPVYLLLLLTCGCYFLLKTAFSVGAKLAAIGKQIVTLRVRYNGYTTGLKGFCDSGNRMRDGFGKGVIVAEWKSLKPLFSNTASPEEANMEWKRIPFRALHSKGVLPAFKPEAIWLERGRRLIPVEPIYIGITMESLDFYHNWDAILPHDFEGVDERHEAYAVQTVSGYNQNTGQASS
ncbi:MAG: sigma-E processing peptidase SpoIIGA [Clostridia bacterium]|nr:sigma-E processing peptidase SpoIIGA [Clostridia bacterium]